MNKETVARCKAAVDEIHAKINAAASELDRLRSLLWYANEEYMNAVKQMDDALVSVPVVYSGASWRVRDYKATWVILAVTPSTITARKHGAIGGEMKFRKSRNYWGQSPKPAGGKYFIHLEDGLAAAAEFLARGKS